LLSLLLSLHHASLQSLLSPLLEGLSHRRHVGTTSLLELVHGHLALGGVRFLRQDLKSHQLCQVRRQTRLGLFLFLNALLQGRRIPLKQGGNAICAGLHHD
jgi:hypothetical protein